MEEKEGIVLEPGVDYVLNEGSIWITVGTLAVHIKKEDEGVVADIYPLNQVVDEVIVRSWVPFSEGETSELDEE